MKLFIHHTAGLKPLNEIPFLLEKDIQKMFEANLEAITGLHLIKSEFTIKNSRIDTLAFDAETNSFVIIEYKRSQNFSVVDQGVSYLHLMLENKADFIIEYNESQSKFIKRNEVDWSQSKIIFVSPSFTEFQKTAADFKDLPIELWEINQFENGTISVQTLKKSKSAPSIKQVQTAPASEMNQVLKETKVYTEDDHLQGKPDSSIELYERFKEALLQLHPSFDMVPQKSYIAFKLTTNIVDLHIQNKGLKLWINCKKGLLDDPKALARDVSSIGHAGNGDYEIAVSDTANLEYIMSLVKQII